jgi:hypothetical protein
MTSHCFGAAFYNSLLIERCFTIFCIKTQRFTLCMFISREKIHGIIPFIGNYFVDSCILPKKPDLCQQ